MTTACLALHSASFNELPCVPGSPPPRALVLIRPTGIRSDGDAAQLNLALSPTFGALVTLKITGSTVLMYDALALFTALTHMPRLEELALFLVTFKRYDGDGPMPAFRLRQYSYSNVQTSGSSPRNLLGRVSGWSLPLIVSASTLRRAYISLRGRQGLEEALSIPEMGQLERLGLRGNRFLGFPMDLTSYAGLIARCPRLRYLALHWINRSDVLHDLKLLSFVTTLLHTVELSFNPERSPNDWEHAQADAAFADVLRTAYPLRSLRLLTLKLPVPPGAREPALLRTRAVCAERQISLRIILQQILKHYMTSERADATVDLAALAARTVAYSGSDIKHLVFSAALAAFKDTIPDLWTASACHGQDGKSIAPRIINSRHIELGTE